MAEALFLISFLPCRPIGSLLFEAILPCKRAARMVDKRELANLLLGILVLLEIMLLGALLSNSPMPSQFSHGAAAFAAYFAPSGE
jgi:hypothetical protein